MLQKLRAQGPNLLKTLGILVATWLVSLWFDRLGFRDTNIVTIYILSVLFIAVWTNDRFFGLFASVINVFAFNFLFTEPRYSLQFHDAGYIVTFLVMFIASFVSATLTQQVRRHAQASALLAVQKKQEELRANLLRSLSHDLRTPLTSIGGNAAVLLHNAEMLDEQKKKQLYSDICDDAKWLTTLVENLLSVTRIENGTLSIRMEPELVEEVVAEALKHIDRHSTEHVLAVDIADDMLLARMDARLIVQVLINLIDNAVHYTPTGSAITVRAWREGAWVVIEVADDGPGIAESDQPLLFDMLYTNNTRRQDGRRGLGLGLPLCKAIVAAHGGDMEARRNAPHGTLMRFTLQAQEVTEDA